MLPSCPPPPGQSHFCSQQCFQPPPWGSLGPRPSTLTLPAPRETRGLRLCMRNHRRGPEAGLCPHLPSLLGVKGTLWRCTSCSHQDFKASVWPEGQPPEHENPRGPVAGDNLAAAILPGGGKGPGSHGAPWVSISSTSKWGGRTSHSAPAHSSPAQRPPLPPGSWLPAPHASPAFPHWGGHSFAPTGRGEGRGLGWQL